MPLLVVPLAADESPLLTLSEWDELSACHMVLFEEAGHPLERRLWEAGVAVAELIGEPDAARAGWGLVCEPGSPRVVGLARAGARVTSGIAQAPDDLSAAHAARSSRRAAASLGAVAIVMARLQSDDGCPWDVKQTHESLAVHLLEETYEVIEEIDNGADGAPLEEELGDVLGQVLFHAELAARDGRFDVARVADRLVAKLVNRHPHVFGDVSVADAHEVLRNWEDIKKVEKRRGDPFEGIPAALPALLAAAQVQKRAARLGFDGSEETASKELAAALDAGDVAAALLWLVALARSRGVEPEEALRRAVVDLKGSFSGP